MKRTVSLRILTTLEQDKALSDLQKLFAKACNAIVPFATQYRCVNSTQLHHLCYYSIREKIPELGAQMVCIAERQVASAYKTLLANRPKLKKEPWFIIQFKEKSSVHFDKRIYTLRGESLSLFTLQGRIIVPLHIGDFQRQYLANGRPKEAELIHKRKGWFFNLVLDLPDPPKLEDGDILGVDMGENNLAATSTGKLFGGKQLCHERDKALDLRRRLQSNGTKSSKQLLKKVSGREQRHVTQVNHEVSKDIVAEAINNGCSTIAMESLTNIRQHIQAGKRVRTRLHRWAWHQLQTFIEYKAEAAGLRVVYVNPAYTSQTCAVCGQRGIREKHRFFCPSCGRFAHADLNAGQNIAARARIANLGLSAEKPTGAVKRPNVATPKC